MKGEDIAGKILDLRTGELREPVSVEDAADVDYVVGSPPEELRFIRPETRFADCVSCGTKVAYNMKRDPDRPKICVGCAKHLGLVH